MPAPTRRPRRTSPPGTAAQVSLELALPSERFLALLRERERLLRKVALKKKELGRVGKQVTESLEKLELLRSSLDRVDEELHALFAELLAEGRLSRRARAQVANVYRTLQHIGTLRPRDSASWDSDDNAEASPFAEFPPPSDCPPPRKNGGGFSAPRPDGTRGHESLRSLFRRLTVALHPDKVQREDEKARRTEAMKEVTHAYERGDIARLLEIEKAWTTRGYVTPQESDDERCLAALERTNEELRAQLQALSAELKSLRHAGPFQLFGELRGGRSRSGAKLIASLVAEGEKRYQSLCRTRDFVLAFRDRKISLTVFLAGPPPSSDDEDLQELLELEAALAALCDEPTRRQNRTARGQQKGRARKAPPDSEDIPF